MKYYYSIGEVSNLIGVKPYVIRYWETEFKQLKPRKEEGRIRKYNDDQILLLKKIKYMLYDQRFTIEGARQKLKAERNSHSDQIELDLTVNEVPEQYALSSKQLETLQQIKTSLQKIKNSYATYLRSNK